MSTAGDNVVLKFKDYKSDTKPIWCPGCGDFAVLNAITKALAQLQLPLQNVALISGIGCSSRIAAYTSVYGFHGVHGRALPLATGLKAARDDMTVLVAGGDGDGLSIGGNHFIHACRRNMDLTYIMMDNEVYGMTKGQASPTTAPDWEKSKLTPEGTGVRSFKPAVLALASGASFIARGFSGDPNDLARMIAAGIEHKGFSFIQALSVCPTYRPEHAEWKNQVNKFTTGETDNPITAVTRMVADDGMSTGIMYQRDIPSLERPGNGETGTLADFESEFEL